MFSIADLANNFKDNARGLDRGQNHYDSGHIIKVTYSNRTMRAVCKQSLKPGSYKVQVSNSVCSI